FSCRLSSVAHPPALHSFPTRRSSDLGQPDIGVVLFHGSNQVHQVFRLARVWVVVGEVAIDVAKQRNNGTAQGFDQLRRNDAGGADRKSTRLNSSHVKISYAVFCLKKK